MRESKINLLLLSAYSKNSTFTFGFCHFRTKIKERIIYPLTTCMHEIFFLRSIISELALSVL